MNTDAWGQAKAALVAMWRRHPDQANAVEAELALLAENLRPAIPDEGHLVEFDDDGFGRLGFIVVKGELDCRDADRQG